jgi:ElaB/YqjD/DUF883 family membrane-anchored ribosome-binding protein
MSSNGSNNMKNSAATSPPVTDHDYLEQEAKQARAAMRGRLAGMKDTLVEGLDLERSADEHPWMTVGAAAAVGLVAGGIVTARNPRHPPSPPAEPARVTIQLPDHEIHATAGKEPWGSQLTSYLGSLLTPPLADILKAFAIGFVAQHIDNPPPPPKPEPSQAASLQQEPPVSVDSAGPAEPQAPEETGSGA